VEMICKSWTVLNSLPKIFLRKVSLKFSSSAGTEMLWSALVMPWLNKKEQLWAMNSKKVDYSMHWKPTWQWLRNKSLCSNKNRKLWILVKKLKEVKNLKHHLCLRLQPNYLKKRQEHIFNVLRCFYMWCFTKLMISYQ
jgi:hypothetical protein